MLREMANTIGVFAASGPFEPDRFEAGLARLRLAGATVRLAPGLQAREGYLAGPDAARLAGLEALLEDPEVDGLLAVRGGYGITRILDALDPRAFERANKPIAGFSDVTALHQWLLLRNLPCIHAPVLTQLGQLPVMTAQLTLEALEGAQRPLAADPGPALIGGVAEGRLWGGNLVLLSALAGTPAGRPPPGPSLLLLEEVGESTYRVDRLLTQLRSAGMLEGVVGIALGDFWKCRPAQPHHWELDTVLADRLGDLGIPVRGGFPVGHGRRNEPVWLGRSYRLDADAGILEPIE